MLLNLIIVHAALATIAVFGILAGVWFVQQRRLIAILVAVATVSGVIASLIGVYLSVILRHPLLFVGGFFTALLCARLALWIQRNAPRRRG